MEYLSHEKGELLMSIPLEENTLDFFYQTLKDIEQIDPQELQKAYEAYGKIEDEKCSLGKVDDLGIKILITYSMHFSATDDLANQIEMCFDEKELIQLQYEHDQHRVFANITYGYLQSHLLSLVQVAGLAELAIGEDGHIYGYATIGDQYVKFDPNGPESLHIKEPSDTDTKLYKVKDLPKTRNEVKNLESIKEPTAALENSFDDPNNKQYLNRKN